MRDYLHLIFFVDDAYQATKALRTTADETTLHRHSLALRMVFRIVDATEREIARQRSFTQGV